MLNFWTNKRRILPLLALLTGMQACFDQADFDPDRMAGVKLNPSLAIPLLHGSLSIADLLPPEESPYIHYDEDQLVHIQYSDTLYSASILDLFLLPQLKINKYYPLTLPALPPQEEYEVISDRQHFDFGFSEARFDEINLKEGQLNISAISNIDADLTLHLSFPTLEKDGEPLQITLNLPASSSNAETAQVNLQDYVADFSDYESGNNVLPVDITGTAQIDEPGLQASINNYIQLNLEMNQLDFSLLKGYLGQHKVALPAGQIPLTVFQTLFNKAAFRIKDPQLSIELLNSNGVPVQATTDILQVSKIDGTSLPLDISPASPFQINYPTEINETALSSFAITNAGEAFALAPDFIDYKISGRLNTGEIEHVNFLTDQSQISAIIHADIPLYGYLEGLNLSDTMAFSLQQEDLQLEVEDALFMANFSNEFPVGVDLQVYFLNLRGDVLDSLFDDSTPQLIRASQVDQQGELSSPGILNQEILINSDRFERILEADKIVVTGLLYTSREVDGSQPDVKIKADHRLELNLGVKTNMNISVKP